MSADTRQPLSPTELEALTRDLKDWGQALGFQQVGIADCDLSQAEGRLQQWLASAMHGDMGYLARHGLKRTRPAHLVPGTLSVISARMDYLPEHQQAMDQALADPARAFVSRYALGRDYHKVLRARLKRLAQRLEDRIGAYGWRVFVDSAPVMEKPLAEKAGLGWIGKHTNLINREAGSWFFLGEIYCDLPLPPDSPAREHCGRCQACIEICPTNAIIAPFQLDARRCISYLTIEHFGSIPEPLRPQMGNHIYGCDDCQLCCPWNRFARKTGETDFLARDGLDTATLIELFRWDEPAFLARTEGSAIRRLGHERWLRNIAVALGNAHRSEAVRETLRQRLGHPSALVREHVVWALARTRSQTRTNNKLAEP
ncbi:tRNA epoxyqueuosine(34) reductase QueG [Halochromatium salexigens]|uniref:Epoxyqueuosine reductase n=1 Tax=Halochromatium salexigens TaxID=49447 RepID=A0AAJ0XEK6_HALSE|nr:tRNA epoxyqueuosine(34) reductase QueG [Halochromatium salexigens]MBK5929924.1 tRNA epoxyqueuosine(34) reductase QueG [Halochromatium salexigens]